MRGRAARVLRRPALLVRQNRKHPLYLFVLTGAELSEIADVARLDRDAEGRLRGYQRAVAQKHVRNITDYLESGEVLFPNSIILALTGAVRFRKAPGKAPVNALAVPGTLEIPIPSRGSKPAWIVDGQQRAMALSRSSKQQLPVPVNAFMASDEAIQREHFLRVNSTKPLPRGLITELLPEFSTLLPPDLTARKIPAALCDLLARDPESPFRGLIRRESTPPGERRQAVVADTALIKMLDSSLNLPSGCLFLHRNVATGETDFEQIRRILLTYWCAVRDTFPEAWGLQPSRSRLMHSVGLRAMGRLMDRVMFGVDVSSVKARSQVRRRIERLAPHCHWTEGRWDAVGGLRWNEIQNVPSHVRMLSGFLVRCFLEDSAG